MSYTNLFGYCDYCEREKETEYTQESIPTCGNCEGYLNFTCVKCSEFVNYWNKDKTWVIDEFGQLFHYTCLPVGHYLLSYLGKRTVIAHEKVFILYNCLLF